MTEKTTATEIGIRDSFVINQRRRRADAFANELMAVLRPFLQEGSHGEAFYALQEMFISHGIEVVTDAGREALGLPPRGPDGWTAEELLAMEKNRLEALHSPMRSIFLRSDHMED